MVVSLFVRKLKHLISMSKNVDYKKMIQSDFWNTLFVSNALLISTYILTKGSNPTLETTYSC